METRSYRTKLVRKEDVKHDWHVVDAEGLTLGRLASKIAMILSGKNKPSYTPHVDVGDYVIVLNAGKVHLSGRKWADKEYQDFSGYPGGRKVTMAKEMVVNKPEALVERAVKGMLPKTRLGRAMYKKLYVYAGTEHPHQAQKPKTLTLEKR